MKQVLNKKPLIVKKSPIQGYGVFADCDIEPGEIIEECYALPVNGDEKSLKNYYFVAGKFRGIATGFGTLYNHSDTPNAKFFFDRVNQLVTFKSTQKILRGEEIFVLYSEDWFSSRNMPVKKISLLRKAWLFLLAFKKTLRAIFVVVVLFLIIKLVKYLLAT